MVGVSAEEDGVEEDETEPETEIEEAEDIEELAVEAAEDVDTDDEVDED